MIIVTTNFGAKCVIMWTKPCNQIPLLFFSPLLGSDHTSLISCNSKMRETGVNPEPQGAMLHWLSAADDKFCTSVNKMTSQRRETNICTMGI